MASVPCGSCRLCCIKVAVVLMPEDDPALYDTEVVGGGLVALKHKANGECVHLGEAGCTIHDHAPIMCRVYDCREQHRMYPREQRRDLVRRGLLDPRILKRGLQLIVEEKKRGPKSPLS